MAWLVLGKTVLIVITLFRDRGGVKATVISNRTPKH
jgi:hypothetical protein